MILSWEPSVPTNVPTISEFAFALQDMDCDIGLAVDLRGVELGGRSGDCRIAKDDLVKTL